MQNNSTHLKKKCPRSRYNHLLLFDKSCRFCRRWVYDILLSDKKKQFALLPLYTEKANHLLQSLCAKPLGDSLLLLTDYEKPKVKLWEGAFAIQKIADLLESPSAPFRIFSLLPTALTCPCYRLIATLRKYLPAKEVSFTGYEERFLEK